MKVCGWCKQEKSHDDFYRCAKSKDGFQHRCKKCSIRTRNDWGKANPEREREWDDNYKQRSVRQRRDKSLRTKFKLSLEEYERMLTEQGGVCLTCGKPPPEDKSLHVDHDHNCCPSSRRSCGQCVRGLLCFKCNAALGNVGDSRQILRNLIHYLEIGVT